MKAKIQNDSLTAPVAEAPSTAEPRTSGCETLLDSQQAAELLRIHPKTLQRMARKGEIPALQIGKLWRFQGSALNEWLEKIRT